jgi:chromosome segregation ATPase
MDWTTIIVAIIGSGATVAGGWFIMRAEMRKERATERVAQMSQESARARVLIEREAALWSEMNALRENLQKQIAVLGAENVELRMNLKMVRQELTDEKKSMAQLRGRMRDMEEENKKLRERLSTGEFRTEEKK